MSAWPQFIGPGYTAQSPIAASERLVNFYLAPNESPGATVPWSLFPTPGLTAFAAVAPGPAWGLWAQDGHCRAVLHETLYGVEVGGVLQTKGLVVRDGKPVTFSSSGEAGAELFVTSGGAGYIEDLTTGVLSAPIAGLLANWGGYLDGFFLALETLTSTIRISDLLDGLTWDPTQFAQRQGAGDGWDRLLVSGQYIYLFGSETTDVWVNVGAFPFPFAPAGSAIQFGIAAPASAADLNGVPYWLSQSNAGVGPVVRATGLGRPERISTHAVETAIRGYGVVTDAEGWGYELDGHRFYVLVFPTANAGWVYDETTSQWHEYLSWDEATGLYTAPRARWHCAAFGTHLVGSRVSGDVYELTPRAYDEAGEPIRRMRRARLPTLGGDGHWCILDEFRLFLQVGIGDGAAALSDDPLVAYRFSTDGGFTWSSERHARAGRAGKYQTRVIWNRSGKYRDGLGAVEVVVTQPVYWALSGASFQARMGAR